MILVFNKTDVTDASFAREWMTDFEKFQDALRAEEEKGVFGGEGFTGGGSGYMGSLLNSMSLMLEEFYKHLSMVGVSSMTGDGVGEFFEKVEEKRMEFERDYRPELERKVRIRREEESKRKEEDLTRVMRDMGVGSGKSGSGKGAKRKDVDDYMSDDDDDDNDGEDDDLEEQDYPDAEREDPGESLKRRYETALREQGGQVNPNEESMLKHIKDAG